MTIIALTSIPPRFESLQKRLRALLSFGADEVVLTIPHAYVRFPDWNGSLPDIPDAVTVLRSADFGPATKIVEVFKAYPDGDVLIADDDCDYTAEWFTAFMAAREMLPDAVIAASTFGTERLGLANGGRIVQGYAGVLIKPAALGNSVLNIKPPACWVDDIWMSAHIAAAGLQIVDCPRAKERLSAGAAPSSLQDALIDGKTRAQLNRAVAWDLKDRLGIWGDTPATKR